MAEFWQIDPFTLTDDELRQYYKKAWERSSGNNQWDAVANILISEMNGRENRKTMKLNFWLSGLAVFFALISTMLAFQAVKGDKEWQKEELKSLSQICATIKSR